MLPIRNLRQIAIVLLCLWILGVFAAVTDLFEASVNYSLEAYYYDETHESPASIRHQKLKKAIREHAKYIKRREQEDGALTDESSFAAAMLLDPRGGGFRNQSSWNGNDNNNVSFPNELGPLNRPTHMRRRRKPPRKFKERFVRSHHRESSPMLLPKPVIVVGFPKAGTSSIFSFFRNQRKHNLKCQHWYCCQNQFSAQIGGPTLMADCMVNNLSKNRSIFDKCGDFDVYAEINGPRRIVAKRGEDIPGFLLDDGSLDYASVAHKSKRRTRMFFPQYFNLEDIHNHYPNATFILNTRPFDSWIKSVQSWQPDLDWQFISEFYLRGEIEALPEDKTNATELVEFMRDIYDRHHARVRQFVEDHPTHAMVEVSILDPDAGKILGDAFGLDPSPWGKTNVNNGGEGRIQITIAFFRALWTDFDHNPLEACFLAFLTGFVLSLVVLFVTRAARMQRKFYGGHRRVLTRR